MPGRCALGPLQCKIEGKQANKIIIMILRTVEDSVLVCLQLAKRFLDVCIDAR